MPWSFPQSHNQSLVEGIKLKVTPLTISNTNNEQTMMYKVSLQKRRIHVNNTGFSNRGFCNVS